MTPRKRGRAAGLRRTYDRYRGGAGARALNLVTIVAWHGCDHLAPVREGDTLRSTIELERAESPGRRRRTGPSAVARAGRQ